MLEQTVKVALRRLMQDRKGIVEPERAAWADRMLLSMGSGDCDVPTLVSQVLSLAEAGDELRSDVLAVVNACHADAEATKTARELVEFAVLSQPPARTRRPRQAGSYARVVGQ